VALFPALPALFCSGLPRRSLSRVPGPQLRRAWARLWLMAEWLGRPLLAHPSHPVLRFPLAPRRGLIPFPRGRETDRGGLVAPGHLREYAWSLHHMGVPPEEASPVVWVPLPRSTVEYPGALWIPTVARALSSCSGWAVVVPGCEGALPACDPAVVLLGLLYCFLFFFCPSRRPS